MIKLIVLSLAFLLVSCTSKSGDNLIKAVKNNDFGKVKRIITQENVSYIDERGTTPMMWAAYNGNIEILDFLVKNGADARKKGVLSVERKDASGKDVIISYPSPLNAAAGEGHLEAVRYLIEKAGVSANEKTIKVRDSIDAKGNFSFFDEEENDKSALIEAVLAHKKEVAEYLLSKGADPDYNEYDPEVTALEAAILTYDYEMAEILLKKGSSADIFTRRSDGFRIYPFFAIVPEECIPPNMDKAGYDKAVKNLVPLLLKNGVTLRNFIFPVSKMCRCKNQELVEFMLSIGFDPEWQFNDTTIGEYCKGHGVEINSEIIDHAVEKAREDEKLKSDLLLKIIRHQTRGGKNNSCTTIKIKTKINSLSSIKWHIKSVPEIVKNGNALEVVKGFFAANKEPTIISGLEKYSCENDGFTSDYECYEQIDGELVYKEEQCPKPSRYRPEDTFSAPFLDPKSNLVFVYNFWYCGPLCARGSLLVYELKSNGVLEYKYGYTLFIS